MVHKGELYVPHREEFACFQENVLLKCVRCWTLCTVTFCTLVERVSNIDGTRMDMNTYYCSMDGLH